MMTALLVAQHSVSTGIPIISERANRIEITHFCIPICRRNKKTAPYGGFLFFQSLIYCLFCSFGYIFCILRIRFFFFCYCELTTLLIFSKYVKMTYRPSPERSWSQNQIQSERNTREAHSICSGTWSRPKRK